MTDPETLAAPPAATATGTSTGTTALTLSAVTGHIWVPSAVSGAGVPAGTIIVAGPQAGGAGVYTTNQNTTLTAAALTFTPSSTAVVFPDFVPPSPPVAAGNPPPPAFPPPSIPAPTGPLGGPLFTSGGTSNTSPSYSNPVVFPGFSTTFPNPPITVSNVWAIPTYSAGPPPSWTSTLPAAIATTPPIALGGWGLPGPQGGPGPPGPVNPPGAGLPHLAERAMAESSIFSFNGDEPPARSLSAAATKRPRHARNIHQRHA
jgi:hypothetical protein